MLWRSVDPVNAWKSLSPRALWPLGSPRRRPRLTGLRRPVACTLACGWKKMENRVCLVRERLQFKTYDNNLVMMRVATRREDPEPRP
jgi:hypothetical protein